MDDFKEGNTIAAKIEGHWRITGVVDLMQGYFGDGEADMSRILSEYKIGEPSAEERVHAFLSAYCRARGEQAARPGFMKRFAIYLIMDQMILWSFGRRLGWFDGIADFRSNCERYMRVRTEILPAALQS